MRMKKFMAAVLTAGVLAAALSGCGGAGSGAVNAQGEKIFNLKLGHNLAEDHAVHKALMAFAEDVSRESEGSINIKIYPNGMLGSETDMLTQIQAGALDMTKVSASTLGNFSKEYNAFSVPYVFDSKEHYYRFMDSPDAEDIFMQTSNQHFIGLTWLDSGSRSFYTKNKIIREPGDLKGLKIRTMDSQMAIDMMKALGGSATVMGYSDIYTGLQQGVIDGAENNVTAMRDHGEIAKYYSFDEHTRIPDIIVLSSRVWEQMSEQQRAVIKKCASRMSGDYKIAWKNFEDEVIQNATQKYGDEFVRDVNIAAFQKACEPIYENLKTADPDTYSVVEKIRAMADGTDAAAALDAAERESAAAQQQESTAAEQESAVSGQESTAAAK